MKLTWSEEDFSVMAVVEERIGRSERQQMSYQAIMAKQNPFRFSARSGAEAHSSWYQASIGIGKIQGRE